MLPRRRASRHSRPNTTNDPGHTREKREASHDLRYDYGSRCDTFRDTENKGGTKRKRKEEEESEQLEEEKEKERGEKEEESWLRAGRWKRRRGEE